jgi:hypothetical protein
MVLQVLQVVHLKTLSHDEIKRPHASDLVRSRMANLAAIRLRAEPVKRVLEQESMIKER